MISLDPLGDRAFLARFATESEARRWASAVRGLAAGWTGVEDVVLAYRSAAVFADPERIDPESLGERLLGIESDPEASGTIGPLLEIPVLYDGEDLPDVADRLGLSTDAVIALHSARDYDVFAVGFLPGFPYAGFLPPKLEGLPRRSSPRTHVAAGSVAIAGRQTGIYPQESPGGWHLIGRTPLRIADLASEYFPIRAGDRIRFRAIEASEFESLLGRKLDRPSRPT